MEPEEDWCEPKQESHNVTFEDEIKFNFDANIAIKNKENKISDEFYSTEDGLPQEHNSYADAVLFMPSFDESHSKSCISTQEAFST